MSSNDECHIQALHAEFHYAECRYAKGSSAETLLHKISQNVTTILR